MLKMNTIGRACLIILVLNEFFPISLGFIRIKPGLYKLSKSFLKSNINDEVHNMKDIQCGTILNMLRLIPFAASFPELVCASSDRSIEDRLYRRGLKNLPSDDFWYPPFLIGRWNVSLTFAGAVFTDKISLEELSEKDNLPGFSPYSVIFAPAMGKDVNYISRFVQLDSHIREDHSHNLRQLVHAFMPQTVVDKAPYSYQKAPDWFHSPSNNWDISYHDPTGEGEVHILTQKRDIQIRAGEVETTEYFRQVTGLTRYYHIY